MPQTLPFHLNHHSENVSVCLWDDSGDIKYVDT